MTTGGTPDTPDCASTVASASSESEADCTHCDQGPVCKRQIAVPAPLPPAQATRPIRKGVSSLVAAMITRHFLRLAAAALEICLLMTILTSTAQAAIYFVDSELGDDDLSGHAMTVAANPSNDRVPGRGVRA